MRQTFDKIMKDIRVESVSHYSHQVAAACTIGAEKFHIWVDERTLKPENKSLGRAFPVLYANPIKADNSTRRDTTRYLNASSKRWAPAVAHLLKHVRDHNLVAAARARLAEEGKAAEAEQAAAAHLERIKESGPALLRALEIIEQAASNALAHAMACT